MSAKKESNKNLPAKPDPTYSERFTNMVISEYSSTISNVQLDEFQMKLAQHLFVKVDMALRDFEANRIKKGQTQKKPIEWKNINLPKLAVDAVHRIELGLDALIPNHIHPVPHFNSKLGVYDLDLRIGYKGKDLYYRKMSLYPIKDIKYGLKYTDDDFEVISRKVNDGVEDYDHKIEQPFDRGEVEGGFGYIEYSENPSMNKLVLLSKKDFDKAESYAQSDKFWKAHRERMEYKTIVHRTVNEIILDPMKINASFAHVENDELQAIERQARIEAAAEIEHFANTEVIDIDRGNDKDARGAQEAEPVDDDQSNEPSEEEQQEIHRREMAEAEIPNEPETQQQAAGPAF